MKLKTPRYARRITCQHSSCLNLCTSDGYSCRRYCVTSFGAVDCIDVHCAVNSSAPLARRINVSVRNPTMRIVQLFLSMVRVRRRRWLAHIHSKSYAPLACQLINRVSWPIRQVNARLSAVRSGFRWILLRCTAGLRYTNVQTFSRISRLLASTLHWSILIFSSALRYRFDGRHISVQTFLDFQVFWALKLCSKSVLRDRPDQATTQISM